MEFSIPCEQISKRKGFAPKLRFCSVWGSKIGENTQKMQFFQKIYILHNLFTRDTFYRNILHLIMKFGDFRERNGMRIPFQTYLCTPGFLKRLLDEPRVRVFPAALFTSFDWPRVEYRKQSKSHRLAAVKFRERERKEEKERVLPNCRKIGKLPNRINRQSGNEIVM